MIFSLVESCKISRRHISANKVSFFCNHLLTLSLNALPQVSFQLVSAFDKDVLDFLIHSKIVFQFFILPNSQSKNRLIAIETSWVLTSFQKLPICFSSFHLVKMSIQIIFLQKKSHFKKDAFAPTVSLQGRRFREGPGEVIFPINPTLNFLQYSGRVFSIRITFDSFLSGTTFLDAL